MSNNDMMGNWMAAMGMMGTMMAQFQQQGTDSHTRERENFPHRFFKEINARKLISKYSLKYINFSVIIKCEREKLD